VSRAPQLSLYVFDFSFDYWLSVIKKEISYLFGAVLFLRNVNCEGAMRSVEQEDLVKSLIVYSNNSLILFLECCFM